jgi:hypothetical protein
MTLLACLRLATQQQMITGLLLLLQAVALRCLLLLVLAAGPL